MLDPIVCSQPRTRRVTADRSESNRAHAISSRHVAISACEAVESNELLPMDVCSSEPSLFGSLQAICAFTAARLLTSSDSAPSVSRKPSVFTRMSESRFSSS